VHIDDLRDSEDMSLNLLVYCGTLISNLLHPAGRDLHTLWVSNVALLLSNKAHLFSLTIEHRDDGEAARTSRDSQVDREVSLK